MPPSRAPLRTKKSWVPGEPCEIGGDIDIVWAIARSHQLIISGILSHILAMFSITKCLVKYGYVQCYKVPKTIKNTWFLHGWQEPNVKQLVCLPLLLQRRLGCGLWTVPMFYRYNMSFVCVCMHANMYICMYIYIHDYMLWHIIHTCIYIYIDIMNSHELALFTRFYDFD